MLTAIVSGHKFHFLQIRLLFDFLMTYGTPYIFQAFYPGASLYGALSGRPRFFRVAPWCPFHLHLIDAIIKASINISAPYP